MRHWGALAKATSPATEHGKGNPCIFVANITFPGHGADRPSYSQTAISRAARPPVRKDAGLPLGDGWKSRRIKKPPDARPLLFF
jgi:hypothetical protein